MNRTDIAKAIAADLLDNDVLDEHNFSYDTAAILEYHFRAFKGLFLIVRHNIVSISNNRYIEPYFRKRGHIMEINEELSKPYDEW